PHHALKWEDDDAEKTERASSGAGGFAQLSPEEEEAERVKAEELRKQRALIQLGNEGRRFLQ
ncbi:unnamed protein product, partial [Amoebophrya sp. A25]